MMRKRGIEHPTAGESSGSKESSGIGGQGGGTEYPVDKAPVPQQQGGRGGGGYYQGRGAGLHPRCRIAHQQNGAPEFQGLGGPQQHRGGMVTQQQPFYLSQGGAQPRGGGTARYEYQERGSSQLRAGMPPHQYAGGLRGGGHMAGGRGVGPSSSPTRPSGPDLHQATQATYHASQPSYVSGPPSGPTRLSGPDLHQATQATCHASQPSIKSEVSSALPVQLSEINFGQVEQKFQDLSIQDRSKPTQTIQIATPAASSRSMRFPSRPGMGTVGKKCIVRANHFLAELPDKDLHQYDVTITPEVTSRGVNRAVMKQLVALYQQSHLGGRLPAYDGRKSLYTAGPLPFGSKNFEINLQDEEDGARDQRRERLFRVAIKFASRVDLHHLGLFLAGKQADAPQEALQVLDIVLREFPTAAGYTPFGRSFYSSAIGGRQKLGEGLESWRGFYQSIRPTQMGLSLNIDMSSTAFIEALPVIDFVEQHLNRDIFSGDLSHSDRVKIKKALRGVKVEVTHRGNMRRKYRIIGLTSQPTRELTFPVDDHGTVKSVVQYFEDTYGFHIQHINLPCLQVGNPQRRNYLPMEVCKIVEGQRYSKRLNKNQISAILKVTCQHPSDQEREILQTVQHNKYEDDPYAQEFGINIGKNLASVEARILPPPRLKYHDSGKERDCLPRVGQWTMMNKKMVNGGRVNNWACINFARKVQAGLAGRFCYQLAQMCQISGLDFTLDPLFPVRLANPDHVDKVLKTCFTDAMKILKPQGKEFDLLIVILPDDKGSLYADVKRICETDLGLVSQCCLADRVLNMKGHYLPNLALKINVKVGGRNTVLIDALSRCIPQVSDIPTIIFGADVTHPHAGEDSGPSIAAVVASQDWPEVTKYAGLVCAQAHRQELIQDLYKEWHGPQGQKASGGMIRELLKSFRNATGLRPERIIFYRDGVSEGQFYQVLLYELDAIRQACESLEQGYQPRVTFVVVQKRHHTRLFANNHRDQSSVDKSGNILPGTVVDSKICHPAEFDFYLCSHAGIRGTSRPAHYHVLWDENQFSADELQTLTNNLCYTYARCTRSVSIVPPAFYAHLAAYRARCYMESETSDGGSIASGAAANNGEEASVGGRRATRGPAAAVVRPLPALKENIKRVMFYC